VIVEAGIQMWLTYAVIAAAVVAYSYERIPLEISGMSTIALLLLIFYLLPHKAVDGSVLDARALLAGFSDPALITIMALLVVGQGLVHTGALQAPARLLISWGQRAPSATLIGVFILVMVVSAVMNNTPVVVMFIPILSALAAKLGRSSAAVMMPLSFVAILGGNLTLIGSSTNLLAISSYTQAGGAQPGFFSLTMPGLVLAAVGLVYIVFIMPRLLADRSGNNTGMKTTSNRQFLFQLELVEDGPMVGEKAIAGIFPKLKDLTIRLIERDGERLLPPYDDITLKVNDVVLIAATRTAMTDVINRSNASVSQVDGVEEDDVLINERKLVAETVVAPASRMDGRTIGQTGFRAETGCAVLGIERRSRMVRDNLNNVRIEAGDVLLVMGSRANVMGLRGHRDVLLMESSAADMPLTAYAGRAQAIFAGIVALASLNVLPIAVTAMTGAVLMMVLRCLNVRQASRAIDRRVFTIVGAALAMGTAMQATGGAVYIVSAVLEALAGAPPWVILSGFFLLIAVLTNMLSNNATAVLFTPIAITLAEQLSLPAFPFLLAVIYGANCSFATPMSYQTNLLVMAPGHYEFRDFVRAGTPLIFINWVTFTIFVPWYYMG